MSSLLPPLARALATSGLLLALGGCGDDVMALVSCSTPAECPVPPGAVSVQCCGGSCVVAASGCDSGLRYVTSEPEVGGCVATALCGQPDMSVPGDLSLPDEDGGG